MGNYLGNIENLKPSTKKEKKENYNYQQIADYYLSLSDGIDLNRTCALSLTNYYKCVYYKHFGNLLYYHILDKEKDSDYTKSKRLAIAAYAEMNGISWSKSSEIIFKELSIPSVNKYISIASKKLAFKNSK